MVLYFVHERLANWDGTYYQTLEQSQQQVHYPILVCILYFISMNFVATYVFH
jgi:hypothetical protein